MNRFQIWANRFRIRSDSGHALSIRRTVVGFTVAALVSTGCGGGGSDAPAPEAEGALTVVVSDPPLVDLVKQVGGAQVDVSSVVPVGSNGHTYEPVPSDARTLTKAKVYIENGFGLNYVVTEFAQANYPKGTPHYLLAASIPRGEVISTDTAEQIKAHGHAHSFNAHFWPDPNYTMLYVQEIEKILATADPANESLYADRASAYLKSLKDLDSAFRVALETIPGENRKLVVYHDSWSYYGRRYGIPVVGAIQPTDFSEPSAEELRNIIEEVRQQKVPAFFGSEVFPSDVLKTIEQETGAAYVADLSDEKLPGEPGSPGHSYVGMMVNNTRSIVTALGGDPSALDAVDPTKS